jgi:hypothetical protein
MCIYKLMRIDASMILEEDNLDEMVKWMGPAVYDSGRGKAGVYINAFSAEDGLVEIRAGTLVVKDYYGNFHVSDYRPKTKN